MLAFDIPNFGTREDFGFPLVSILTSLCRHQSSIMIEIRKYAIKSSTNLNAAAQSKLCPVELRLCRRIDLKLFRDF